MTGPVTSLASQLVPMESNFLVPNGTFLVELAAFGLLFFLLAKYVIPPINKAMTNRQDAIRKEFADLEKSRADANAAEAEFKAFARAFRQAKAWDAEVDGVPSTKGKL